MVLSKINKDNVKYSTDKHLEQEDMEHSTFSYEDELYTNRIEIALGKENHSYSRYNIVYFPVYLILNDIPVEKIGIFEIESKKILNSMDDEGAVDLNEGEILYFIQENELNTLLSEVDNNNQGNELKEEEEIKLTEEDYEDISEINADDEKEVMRVQNDNMNQSDKSKEKKESIFIVENDKPNNNLLEEENEVDSNRESKNYVERTNTTWIEKFMKNNNFDIIDNEGGGDCLFATIRDAFDLLGKKTTVSKLRDLLSNEATEELYTNYRSIYLSFLNEYNDIENQQKELKKQMKILKNRIDKNTMLKENQILLDQLKSLLDTETRLKENKSITKDLLNEFSFIKNVDSLESFKEYIKKSDYWGDTWAITTLERVLNIKLILLSEESYVSHPPDLDSVMQCGQINDYEMDKVEAFVPDYYIMVSYTGNHYKLITYKKKSTLKFKEIPYDIKSLIINKCLERNSGPYNLIPDFRKYKESLGLIEKKEDNIEDDINNKDLYDKEEVIMFHSSSNPKPKAGKGSGESIRVDSISKYNNLNKIKNWRRKLDDMWEVPITIEGLRWGSVKHYELGSQYKKGFPDFYKTFSLDSGSEISENVEMAISAASKSGMYKEKRLRPQEVQIDSDYYEINEKPRHILERERALEAKFTQNKDMKQVLAETQRAKLIQFRRGKDPLTDESLMRTRKKIVENVEN